MDFENKLESPHSTSPNPSVLCDSSKAQPSHKRKAGRKKFKETRHPVYRGVRQRNGNKWVCEIREPKNKSRIWLGTYPTPEIAARAHDVAVLALKGTSAAFNFPDSIFLLPVPKSCSAKDIRAAASKLNTTTTTDVPFKQNAAFCSSLDHNNNFAGKINVMEDMSMMHGVDDDDDGCKAMFLDEEALYNMPGLLDSMAEGLLITPPSMTRAMDWEDIGCEVDLTLWTD